MNPIKLLNEKRGRLITEADQIIQNATLEKRDLTGDEHEKLGGLKSEIFQTDQQIARAQADLNARGNAHFADRENGGIDISQYSILRAINGAASGRLEGFEREISDELARRSGKPAAGFHLPVGALVESRAMTATGGSNGDQGGLAISTMTTDILAALRPYSRVIAAGATTFSGLSSNISVPRQNAASTTSWVAENAALPDVSGTLNQLSLEPNRIGSYVELSNMLLAQTSNSIEQFIKNDLLNAIAAAIDAAAIFGTGLSNQPLGLLAATSGIGSVVGGTDGLAPTWSHICQLVQRVADANADAGSLAYLTNSAVAAKLRSTARIASTDSKMLLEGSTLLDYPLLISNNVPSTLDKGSSTGVCSAIIFGNWQDIIVAQWGQSVEIIVDRFSLATTGLTRVVATSYADIAIRRPESFSAMKDALTA